MCWKHPNGRSSIAKVGKLYTEFNVDSEAGQLVNEMYANT